MREMKDSGVEWIGSIPVEWKVDKIRYHLRRIEPRNPGNKIVLSLYRELGIVPKDSRDDNHNVTSEDTSKYKYVRKGDFVINKMKAWQGSVAVSEYEGIVSPAYYVYHFIDDKYNKKYFHYLLRGCYKDEFMRLSAGIRVGQWDLSSDAVDNTVVLIPDKVEQQKIADFLDKKCAEIDILTSDIQKQIDTLEQYKKSVITEAVTKGLNPDAEMKDSGVDWIGDIPSDWETIKIGRLFSIRNERNTKPMDEVQLLSLYTGIGVFPHGEQEERGNKAVTVEGYKIVHKNDIVVNIILAWMGAIGISEYDGVTSPAYDIYVPDTRRVIPHFYHYVFRTKGIAGECYKYGRGIMLMRWRTYAQEFKQISVPFPSIETQQEIADYLDKKCSEIDTIISDKKKQLEVITEYKKSLIYEYVTGKKEVM